MKKALSLILAIIMVVGLMPTAVISAFAEDTQMKQDSTKSTIPEGAIAINTAAELLALDGTASGKYYYLAADIDLGTAEGAVNGVLTLYNRAITLNASTLDGNGKSITGFRLESKSGTAANLSLFTATGSCTVKNLTLGSADHKIEVDMVNGNTSYAVVMADIPGGTTQTFENVTVYTTMTAGEGTTASDRRGGAFIGRVYGTVKLTDCEAYGSITDETGEKGFGGFIGLIPADVQVTITDCTNHVSITSKRMAGGFIGQSNTAKLTMSGCVNNGDITLSAALAGGFMGQFYANSATANANSITNCTNNGTVIGTDAIGGFTGEWNSKAKSTRGTITFTGFNQSGAVQATSGDCGGIIGKFLANDDLTVKFLRSDNTGSVEATGRAGGIFGYSGDVPSAGVTVTVDGGFSANSITSTGGHAGGLVGYAAVLVTYKISNYTNEGTITTTASNQNAGGLFGQLKTVKPLTVQNFTNTGEIISKNNGAAMIGQYDSPSSTASFIGCRNAAKVTAQSGSAGMIVGWGSGTVVVTVENCVNSGIMNGAGRAGGFFGGMTSGNLTVKNSKNMVAITGNGNNSGGFAGDYTVNGTATVDRFENYGAINANANHAGGFAGILTVKGDASLGEMVNNGAVKAKAGYAAAFFGQLVTNGYSVTVEDVLNTGSVTSPKKAAVVVGWMNAGSISVNRGINLGAVTSGWNSTGTFGFSEATTKSITVTNCVNLGKTNTGDKYYPIWFEGISDTEAYNNDFGSTNSYLASTVSGNMPTNGATALADLDAALALLNTDTYSVWKGFKASDVDENGKATGIVLATPVLYGVQLAKNVTDGKTSLRFVGTIQNTLRYSEIGITVSLNGVPQTKSSKYVYEHLTAVGADDNVIKYSAAEMGGKYAFALTVTDVPVTGTYVFTVKPYAIDTDGTRYDSATAYEVTFTDGVVVNVAVAE